MKDTVLIRLFILTLLIGTCSSWRIDEKPVAINFFSGTYQQALDEAKKEGKLVFIDAYTSWCGPCKLLANNVFTDKTVGNYFNQHFINLRIDMERGEGPALAAKYKVTHFPTLIIADDQGRRVTFTVGYIMAMDMLGFGEYGVQKMANVASCPEEK